MNVREINLWERVKEKADECRVTLKLRDVIELYDENDHSLGKQITVEEAYAFLCGYEHSRCAAKLAKPTELLLTIGEMIAMKDKQGFIRIVVPLTMSELRLSRDEQRELFSQWISGGNRDVLKNVGLRFLGVDDKECVLTEIVGNIKDWLKANDRT